MKKNYILALGIYLFVQFSGLFGVPKTINIANWIVIKYSIGLLLIILILNNDLINTKKIKKGIKESIYWSVGGAVLVISAQFLIGHIESLIGFKHQSNNTTMLLNQIKTFPITILFTSLLAPVTEEIVFRKIIFRTLQKKTGFFIATLISSSLFGIIHFDFRNMITYIAMGFVFSFIYQRTNRIFVPIVSHLIMNSFAIVPAILYLK